MKHRKHNIGKSDYAEHKIQPWDIWREYNLDPWRADIVKRVLRTKDGVNEVEELEKIKHVCDELIAYLSHDEHAGQTKMNLDDVPEEVIAEWNEAQSKLFPRTNEEMEVMRAVRDAEEGAIVDMKGVSIKRFMEMLAEDEQ